MSNDLTLKQASERFISNEERINTFVNAPNGEESYTTSTGVEVASLPYITSTLLNTTRHAVVTVSSSSGVVTLDLSTAGVYKLTLTENVTSWVFNHLPDVGFEWFGAVLIQQGSSAYTCVSPQSGTGETAGGDWIVSPVLNSRERLILAIDSSGNCSVYPAGVQTS